MDHVRYHPSIAKYTYLVEYVEGLPSKKSYREAQECAEAGLKYGKARFGDRLINIKVLREGKFLDSWRQ